MKSLTHKLVIFVSALVVVVVAISGWFAYEQTRHLLLERALPSLRAKVEASMGDFLKPYAAAHGPLQLLATAPSMQALLRAKLAMDVDQQKTQVLLRDVENLLQNYIKFYPDTWQIRLEGVATNGAAWLIVVPAGAQPIAVVEDKLGQTNQGGEPEASPLRAGEVRYSAIESDISQGAEGKPSQAGLSMTLRVDYAGQPAARLVVYQKLTHSLEQLRGALAGAGQLYVVEPRHFRYVVHPDRAKQLGQTLGTVWGLSEEFPLLAEGLAALQSVQTGGRSLQREDGEHLVHMAWYTVGQAGRGADVGVIYRLPRQAVLGAFDALVQRSLWINLALVMVALLGSALFAGSVTRPLRHLAQVISGYGRGEHLPLQYTERSDEVGQIGETFLEMRQAIEARTQALEEEEQRLNSLFESAVDGILIIDAKGIIQRYNAGACKLFGYTSKEALGKNVSLLMQDVVGQEHDLFITRFLQEGGTRVVGNSREVEARHKDGSALPVQLSVSHFKYAGEDYFTGICHDLRHQHWLQSALKMANDHLESQVAERTEDLTQANQALQQEVAEHQLTQAKLFLVNQVFEKARQAIVITDHNNKILDVNPAYEALTGFQKQQVVGHDPAVGKSGRHDPAFYARMWRSLLSENHWEGEVWDRRSDGSIYPKYLSIDRVLDRQGSVLNYVAMFQDLTEQKATEEELERLSHYDPLTGLPNRALFRNRLEHEFLVARRHNRSVALVLINLDRFKQINDSFGFTVGDRLLAMVAKRLEQLVRKTDLIARQENRQERDSDTLSRLGGDEFSIILAELRAAEDAAIVARRTVALLEEPYDIEGQEVFLGGSLGVSIYPENAESLNGMIQCAERALVKAKEGGRNTFRFYSEEMNRHSAEQVRLETELRRAVMQERFQLHYQPKLEIATGEIEGVEALVRWPRRDGRMFSPDAFIPLAEETGLIVPLGRWILKQACADVVAINAQRVRPLRVAVNLSAKQFQQEDLEQMVLEALEETGLETQLLELELTESMMMGDVDEAINTMSILKGLGLTLSIDDFGTGYSSLSYLKRFPVDALKIDQSFVRDLERDSEDAAIVHAVCNLGESLGMKVVAEGIETQLQMDFLRQLNCDTGQGYFIARPMPLAQLQDFLAQHQG
ncbi:diguanylate cyclase/phosphodiesterase with PAS/PAC sensor(s) [Magnetococcus marinus MC-1]|uniref:Diguanylate cyclase/phosphodiesterase with PAS/PAC sensor(S) n=1 Tax=Magnetococcus marinus (strain ATCC BAA-1437 / JCM 17883 / MC-1) TaxID=156889 RepID=A0LBX0_MAGMM|nr:EAL domain-containing protein [Magnetococcus marinus]ABK45463.1 diguanylate cyclase/phosphodiesterase with PAS/PAC sensor(s) [Magnetococcus marinus MC-1]